MTRFFKVVCRVLGGVICTAGILFTMVFGYLSIVRLMGSPLPMIGGWGSAIVTSGSMEPNIPTGSLVLIAQQEAYTPGDVITYQDEGTLVTHRLQEMTSDAIVTRGDANDTDDAPIQKEQICGTVMWIIPGFGSALLEIKSQVWMLGAAGALFAASVWFNRDSKSKKSQNGDSEDHSTVLESKKRKWPKQFTLINATAICMCLLLGIMTCSIGRTIAKMISTGIGTSDGKVAAFAFNTYKSNETDSNKGITTLILYGENVKPEQVGGLVGIGNTTGQIVGSIKDNNLCSVEYPFKVTSHKEKDSSNTRTAEVSIRYDIILALPGDLPDIPSQLKVKLKKVNQNCKDTYPKVKSVPSCEALDPVHEWDLPAPFDTRTETKPNPTNPEDPSDLITTTTNFYKFSSVGGFDYNTIQYDELAFVFEAQTEYWQNALNPDTTGVSFFYDNIKVTVRAYQIN